MTNEDECEKLVEQGWSDECPRSGDGCNAWNYRTVIQLLSSGLPKADVSRMVKKLSRRTDKAKLDEETARHLERAEAFLATDEEERAKLQQKKRPHAEFDFDCLRDQVTQYAGKDPREALEEATEECHNSAEFLPKLFKTGETTCVLRGARQKRDLFYSAGKVPMIFYSLLESPEGVFFLNNPVQGVPVNGSYRSKECVTEFRHLVIECDHREEDYPDITTFWLWYLMTLDLPVKSIVTSGGKSVHALVDLNTKTESEFEKIAYELHEPLVMSGADPNSLTSVRLTRLPFSLRNGSLQELLYVNSDPKGAIVRG